MKSKKFPYQKIVFQWQFTMMMSTRKLTLMLKYRQQLIVEELVMVILSSTLVELDVVSVTFRGDYHQRPQVSIAIADWLETSDFEIDGPMISIFHVTPYETDQNPENWITEVCYAVKKIKSKFHNRAL